MDSCNHVSVNLEKHTTEVELYKNDLCTCQYTYTAFHDKLTPVIRSLFSDSKVAIQLLLKLRVC